MSALPPKADIETPSRDVRFDKSGLLQCSKPNSYSIKRRPSCTEPRTWQSPTCAES